MTISDALVRSVGSLEKLDAQFADFARQHAESFGADADWSKEGLPEKPSQADLESWLAAQPNNYWGLLSLANAAIAGDNFEQAKTTLEKLRGLQTMTAGPMELLASVYRKLNNTEAEREALEWVVAHSSDSLMPS
jgi:uncharacterized protein HemY